jgi:tRNA dimethylallyltransferase
MSSATSAERSAAAPPSIRSADADEPAVAARACLAALMGASLSVPCAGTSVTMTGRDRADPLELLEIEDGAPPSAILIAGPTASGKSALALDIAERTGGVIVNADSMQVYADLAILSARPTTEEERQTPHRLYGFVPSREEFSVGAYLRAAAPVLAGLLESRTPAVIVGGTGLYFKALIEGLTETPEIPDPIRARVAALPDLHAALEKRDAVMAQRLSPADAPRLQRALEVVEATGRSLSDWWREGQSKALLKPGAWRGLLLDPPRDALAARIEQRFAAMVAEGALDEVKRLAAMRLPPNRGVMKAHGMPHLIAHIDGLIDLPTAIIRGQNDTRRYAKRQRIFFRTQLKGFVPFQPAWARA